jgi:hypothetical protein
MQQQNWDFCAWSVPSLYKKQWRLFDIIRQEEVVQGRLTVDVFVCHRHSNLESVITNCTYDVWNYPINRVIKSGTHYLLSRYQDKSDNILQRQFVSHNIAKLTDWRTDRVITSYIIPCSPLKVNRNLWSSCQLHLQGRWVSQVSSACLIMSCWFFASLTLQPSWRRWHNPPKCQLTFNGLRAVISQKTELFISTAVRTSNLDRFVSRAHG